jgi:cell division transport system permease protein
LTKIETTIAAGKDHSEIAPVRPMAPLVPQGTVAGRALIVVIAIMSFFAALTVGAVHLVRSSAIAWRSDVAREVTIEVRPIEGRNLEAEVAKAMEIARRTRGVSDVRAINKEEMAQLLEPWLGAGFDPTILPLPRLILVHLAEADEPDLFSLRRTLAEQVAGASLDDHRRWMARLSALSDTVVIGGTALLVLVLIATMLSTSFATRGALAANNAIIEVLHFVGARDSFVAGEFQRHFLKVSAKGAVLGGAVAALLFVLASLAPELLAAVPGGGEAALIVGRITLDAAGYGGIAGVVLLVIVATALTARLSVHRTLRTID